MVLICPATYRFGSTKRLALRDWPVNNWKSLIRMLMNANICVKVVASIDQVSDYEEFRDIVIQPENIGNLFSVIERGRLVVTQDSGYMHIARYKKIKVISLFGPTNPSIFATAHEIIVHAESITCSPCHNGIGFTSNCNDNQCMKSIDVEGVYEKILQCLM